MDNQKMQRTIVDMEGMSADERLQSHINLAWDTLKLMQEHQNAIIKLEKHLDNLQVLLRAKFPHKELVELNTALQENTALRGSPPKVEHHHHIPKLAIISAVLFLAVALLAAALYTERGVFREHKANAFKYRHLQLENNRKMSPLLRQADSLYTTDPETFEKKVLQEEERRADQMQYLLEAQQKEREAKELKTKAKHR